MKDGKQRQAEHAQRLKELGLRQVAAWVSDTESWMVTQASSGAKADRLEQTGNYMAGLVDRSRQELVDCFLDTPGKMALFETEKASQRKAIGVKVIPFRTLPVLATQVMTPNTTWRELADAHPLLERVTTLDIYHWDNPEFRAACDELELDPDLGRPRFREPYEALAEELLLGCAVRFGEAPELWHPLGYVTEVMLDVLDLMQADLRPSPSLLNRVQENWPKIDHTRLPQADALGRLIATDELLRIGPEQHGANDGVGLAYAAVDFLPSRHGGGYSASIYGFFGDYESDGWATGAYADLHGIAVEPDPNHLAGSAWLRVVRRRLLEQGVVFIPQAKVDDYLATEGVYWIDRWGGTAKWDDARTPTWGERMLWRLKPPPLLVDRELGLRELARRGSAGGNSRRKESAGLA